VRRLSQTWGKRQMHHQPIAPDPKAEIQRLRKEMAELEHRLEQISAALAPQDKLDAESIDLPLHEDRIRQLLRSRRLREQQLGADLFADPAWDILLQALAAELGRERLPVSEVCDECPVPTTSALRWINKLEDDGWLVRDGDPLDPNESWIELSPCGSTRLRSYLHAISATLFAM